MGRRQSDGRFRDVGDEELVYRVAGGDERALSELYDRYSRLVYATGIRLLRDVSLAEELVQDAFTNVWRRAETFDPERVYATESMIPATRPICWVGRPALFGDGARLRTRGRLAC